MKLARDLLKDDLAKAKTVGEKQALAKKLLGQAAAAPSADAGAFALIELARDVSVQAADGTGAFQAIDTLAERYQIDAAEAKAETLGAFAKKARTPPQHLAVAEQAARLMDTAAAAGNFTLAVEMAKLAMAEGGLGHGKDLVARAKAGLTDSQNAARLAADFEAAQARLADLPDDPAAHLTAGRYYCFLKGDWKTGLPHLAKGSDAKLQALAQQEVAAKSPAADQRVAIADGWWDEGQNADGGTKLAILRHAGSWYAKAGAELSGGLDKVKVEKRLEEIAKMESESPHAAAAVSRFTVPINKWFRLLTSPQELIGWEVGDCRFGYAGGVVELNDGYMFCPIVAKDGAIGAKVMRTVSGASTYLILRNSAEGCYAAALEGNMLKILSMKHLADAAGDRPPRERPTHDALAEVRLPQDDTNLAFELTFAASGSALLAYINGRPAVQARDTAFTEGTVGLGALDNAHVRIADVQLLVPDKTSLVADRRAWSSASRGGASEFWFPPANK